MINMVNYTLDSSLSFVQAYYPIKTTSKSLDLFFFKFNIQSYVRQMHVWRCPDDTDKAREHWLKPCKNK